MRHVGDSRSPARRAVRDHPGLRHPAAPRGRRSGWSAPWLIPSTGRSCPRRRRGWRRATPSSSHGSAPACRAPPRPASPGSSPTPRGSTRTPTRSPTSTRISPGRAATTARASTTWRPSTRCWTAASRDEALLSHDLIEGAHVRVGLASDIELLRRVPRAATSPTPAGSIAGSAATGRSPTGCCPRCPARGGGRAPNPLDPMNRWKILDNLRRSLVPVAIGLCCWSLAGCALPASAWAWSVLVALGGLHAGHAWPRWLAGHGLSRGPAQPRELARARPQSGRVRSSTLAFLPHQACPQRWTRSSGCSTGASSRDRQLLEWQTAQMATRRRQGAGVTAWSCVWGWSASSRPSSPGC